MFSFSCLCSSSSSTMGCGVSKFEHEAVRSACEPPPSNHRGDHHHHHDSHDHLVHHKNKILPMQEMEVKKPRSNSEDDVKEKDHRWMEKKDADQNKQSGHPEVQKEDQEVGPHIFYSENSLFFPGSPSFREYCVNNIVVDDDCDSRDSFNFNKGKVDEEETEQNSSETNNIADGDDQKKQNMSQLDINVNVDGDHQIKQNNIVKSEMKIINIDVDGEQKQNCKSEIMETRRRDHADKVQQPDQGGPQHNQKKVGRVRRFRNAISRNRQARKSTLNVHNSNDSSSSNNNNNNPQKLVGKAA